MVRLLRCAVNRRIAMQRIDWKGWLDPKPIFHNVVSNFIWLGIVLIAGLIIAFWSYLKGQSGPWIAIAGMGAGGTCLYLIAAGLSVRQRWQQSAVANSPLPTTALVQPPSAVETKMAGLATQLHSAKRAHQEVADQRRQLEQELQAAKAQLAESNTRISQAQKATADARLELKQAERAETLAKLVEMKAVIKEQIDSASKEFSYDAIIPWVAGANQLLSHMKLSPMPWPIHEGHGDQNQGRKWHQENLAYLRSLIIKLDEHDVWNLS
jgi:hypothetical protein